MESLAGKLLIASPGLLDPNFARTVVFLLSHSANGALGVIINRPSEARLENHLPGWAAVVASPSVFFHGGPVERTAAIAVTYEGDPHGIGDGQFARGYALANLNKGPEALTPPPVLARVFLGYSGWGAGQLDGEVEQGGWFVVESRPADVFNAEPGQSWSRILQRQGAELATLAHFPRDPRAN